ncbi:MAG: DUF4402 domain-containing protein [Sphingomonadaceae bacterium]
MARPFPFSGTLQAGAVCLAVWTLTASPTWAQGACPQCDLPPGERGNGRNKAELKIETDLDFGRLVISGSGAGQVIIDMQTGQRITSGEIAELGGFPMAGHAIITGRPMRVVRVVFPDSVLMRNAIGGEATLRNFQTDLPAMPVLDAHGTLEFNFTGTLIANTPQGGDLRGRIPISVSYD